MIVNADFCTANASVKVTPGTRKLVALIEDERVINAALYSKMFEPQSGSPIWLWLATNVVNINMGVCVLKCLKKLSTTWKLHTCCHPPTIHGTDMVIRLKCSSWMWKCISCCLLWAVRIDFIYLLQIVYIQWLL